MDDYNDKIKQRKLDLFPKNKIEIIEDIEELLVFTKLWFFFILLVSEIP
jgi:hypothetical protein